jgi:hypothetical protein
MRRRRCYTSVLDVLLDVDEFFNAIEEGDSAKVAEFLVAAPALGNALDSREAPST